MITSQIYIFFQYFAITGDLRQYYFFVGVNNYFGLNGKFAVIPLIFSGVWVFPCTYFFAYQAKRMDLFKRATFQTTYSNNLKINII